jgi:hypothetical protein
MSEMSFSSLAVSYIKKRHEKKKKTKIKSSESSSKKKNPITPKTKAHSKRRSKKDPPDTQRRDFGNARNTKKRQTFRIAAVSRTTM